MAMKGWGVEIARMVPGIAVGVAAALAAVAPAWGGDNASATMGIWQDHQLLVKVGDPQVAVRNPEESGEVQLSVGIQGGKTLRAVEFWFRFDGAGMQYGGLSTDPALKSVITINPKNSPEEGLAVFAMAMKDPIVLPADKPMEMAILHFHVSDTTHIKVGLDYMETIDADNNHDIFGEKTKPAETAASAAKAAKPRTLIHELGDGYWWSEPDPNPFARHFLLSFNCPDSARVDIQVLDANGGVVRPLVGDTYKGSFTTNWRGTDFGGKLVHHGDYTVTVNIGGRKGQTVAHFVDDADLPKQ